jgi:hypothetical protein
MPIDLLAREYAPPLDVLAWPAWHRHPWQQAEKKVYPALQPKFCISLKQS